MDEKQEQLKVFGPVLMVSLDSTEGRVWSDRQDRL